jgi:hypothetical protein
MSDRKKRTVKNSPEEPRMRLAFVRRVQRAPFTVTLCVDALVKVTTQAGRTVSRTLQASTEQGIEIRYPSRPVYVSATM